MSFKLKRNFTNEQRHYCCESRKAPSKVKNIIMMQHRIPSPKVLCCPTIPLTFKTTKKKKKKKRKQPAKKLSSCEYLAACSELVSIS
jgi:hypothetical protein